MFAVTAILSCVIKIRGLFKSTKWRHFENVKFEVLSGRRDFDYTNVTFPATQKDYRKIEILNSIDINDFGYEKQEPYPVHISKEKFNYMLNLLLITKGKEQHYVLIKDFNKFM